MSAISSLTGALTNNTPPAQIGSPQNQFASSSGLSFNADNTASYNGTSVALSDIIDNKSGKFTEDQQKTADKLLQGREQKAFGYLYGDPSKEALTKYFTAYVKYVNDLSPEEQNSQRYKGTVQSAQAALSTLAAQPDSSSSSSLSASFGVDSTPGILRILKGTNDALKKISLAHTKTSPYAQLTDVVSLSSAAQAAQTARKR